MSWPCSFLLRCTLASNLKLEIAVRYGQKYEYTILAYLGSDLVAALAGLQVHDFPHTGGFLFGFGVVWCGGDR